MIYFVGTFTNAFQGTKEYSRYIANTGIYDIMRLNKRFFFLNRVKQAKWGKRFAFIPPKAPEAIKALF
jgi:hypothetical protein